MNNTLVHNGTNPQPGDDPLIQFFATAAADLTIVMTVPVSDLGNCFAGNTYSTFKSLFAAASPVPDQARSCN